MRSGPEEEVTSGPEEEVRSGPEEEMRSGPEDLREGGEQSYVREGEEGGRRRPCYDSGLGGRQEQVGEKVGDTWGGWHAGVAEAGNRRWRRVAGRGWRVEQAAGG